MLLRALGSWLIAIVVSAWAPGATRADDRPVVVVLGGSAELIGQLRIQLVGEATVVDAPASAEGELAESLRATQRVREESGADVAVWVRVESGSGAHVLHVAGRRADSAFVRSWRASGLDGADRDRAIAIMLGEMLAALLAQGSEVIELAPAPGPSDAERWRFVLGLTGVGVWVGGPNQGQGGLRLHAGARWESRAALVECLVGAGWVSPIGVESALGDVEVRETDVRGKLSAFAWINRRVALGGAVEVIGRFARARGMAPDGRRGSALTPLLAVGAAFEGRWRLADSVDLLAGVGAEVSPRLERYAIDAREVFSLGRLRLYAELGIVVALP